MGTECGDLSITAGWIWLGLGVGFGVLVGMVVMTVLSMARE